LTELNEETIKQYVLDKKFTCGVCGGEFTERVIRMQKLRFISSDDDLHPNYDPIDPLLYDVIICPLCGYCAIGMFFNKVSSKQKPLILNGITPKFRPHEWSKIITYKEAAEKHKLALVTAMVKGAKKSELGYICTKIAWLSRLNENETGYKEFAEKAIKEFELAYEQEDFPICQMDECTFGYLLAHLLYVTGRYDDAMRWLGRVITNRNVSSRVKERSLDLKNTIIEKQKSE